jgi:3-methyladenine DNA glycosylase AlkD
MIMSTTETNKMSDYILPLQALFTENADPEQAKPMAKYMRDQFEYLGIKTPQRNALFKQFLAENGLPPADELQPVVRQLWQQPAREYQYVALGLLEKMK